MSPTLLARLRHIERETRRLAGGVTGSPDTYGARYPRDYLSPVEMVTWRWVAEWSRPQADKRTCTSTSTVID